MCVRVFCEQLYRQYYVLIMSKVPHALQGGARADGDVVIRFLMPVDHKTHSVFRLHGKCCMAHLS